MKNKAIVIFCIICCLSCDKSTDSTEVRVSVFLYESCPVAQYMTLPLNEIYEEFSSEKISFTGYFPNILSTPETIDAFQQQYAILFNCVDDDGGAMVELLGPNVYAEVFVEEDGVIVYRGMIDNSYSALGQWSPADKYYLYDVLTAIFNGEEVPWEGNTAVGCLI